MLVVARRHSPGVRCVALGRGRPSDRRWGQPDVVARADHLVLQVRDDVAGRSLPHVRRRRQRLRARRRLRRPGAQAPVGRPARSRSGAGGGARLRGQPGRSLERLHGAQSSGAGGRGACGAGPGGPVPRGGDLRGGARHRHATRRPDRGRRARRGVRPSARARDPVRGRLGQDQHRAPRSGGWRRGRREGGPGPATPAPSGPPPPRATQPVYHARWQRAGTGAPRSPLARAAGGSDRRDQLVRRRWNQRPRAHRPSTRRAAPGQPHGGGTPGGWRARRPLARSVGARGARAARGGSERARPARRPHDRAGRRLLHRERASHSPRPPPGGGRPGRGPAPRAAGRLPARRGHRRRRARTGRARGAAGGVRVPRSGLAVAGHGPAAARGVAHVSRRDGGV